MAIIMNPMSFIDVRDTFLFNLMFTGMLRGSEAIAPRYKDVVLHTGPTGLLFLFVFVEMSKTDQARVGDTVVIEESPMDRQTCVVDWYCKYVALRNPSAEYLFHQACGRVSSKMSVRTASDRMNVWCTKLGLNPKLYGSHSCRRGGATAAARAGVAERLIQRHGRWKSLCVRLYIVDDLFQRLLVSQAVNAH